MSIVETTIRLKPKEQWPDPTKKTSELMAEMDKAINFPGVANAWTMPIKTRIDMLSTGIKTPVGIKVSGPDLVVLQKISQDIEQACLKLRLLLEIALQDVIQSAIGGMNITETVEGLERYPVNLRYPRELRDDLETLKRVLIPTPTGTQIPIAMVAGLVYRRGAPVIKSEDAGLTHGFMSIFPALILVASFVTLKKYLPNKWLLLLVIR